VQLCGCKAFACKLPAAVIEIATSFAHLKPHESSHNLAERDSDAVRISDPEMLLTKEALCSVR
jgi:hypothetical protein